MKTSNNESLVWLTLFFAENPEWFSPLWKAKYQRTYDDKSYSTEMWEEICLYVFGKRPKDKNDPLWDKLLVDMQMLKAFSDLLAVLSLSEKAA